MRFLSIRLILSLILAVTLVSLLSSYYQASWPSSESFGICPWQPELLDGMLAADLVGFHVQSHCTNFLQTVDRTLESRIDREHFAVNRGGHQTRVKPFPISVVVPDPPDHSDVDESRYIDRTSLLRGLGIEALFLGVGVDRVDYTKGIIERFLAILSHSPRFGATVEVLC